MASVLAAVQMAPVPGGSRSTVKKLCDRVAEAAGNGADLVVFGESVLPGYPYWAWYRSPVNQIERFVRFADEAVEVDGEEVARIREVAAAEGCAVVLGITERTGAGAGTLYNTSLVIDERGRLLGRHRKLVPTFAEKLVWGRGDGSGLMVHRTRAGRVGSLICGENTNPLARYALLASGEEVHASLFPSFPIPNWYREADVIELRCRAHAFEGKVFVVGACTLPSAEDREELERELPAVLEASHALSGVWGPSGGRMCPPLVDDEGIVYSVIDLSSRVEAKMMHDVTGDYGALHVLSLNIDARRPSPVHWGGGPPPDALPEPDGPHPLRRDFPDHRSLREEEQ